LSTIQLLKREAAELREAFFEPRYPSEVAELLEVENSLLAYYLKGGSDGHYRLFQIPKKSGDVREIAAPITPLKIVQGKLHQVLTAVYEPRAAAHGFVRERSIVTNARKHQRKRWVLNLDLEDFFPSIHFGRVRGLFMAKPCCFPEDVATTLARICCYRSKLPQGAPTSPIVSNMICARMDKELSQLAERYRCVYTRYADDITVSTSQAAFPSDIARLRTYPAVPEVELGTALTDIVAANGFGVNRQKVRLRRYNRRQEVTGLTVNQFPNVTKRFLRRLRAMLHAWGKFGYEAAEDAFRDQWDRKYRSPDREPVSFRRVIEGNLEYLKMVRGEKSAPYLRYYQKFLSLINQTPYDAVWVLESDQYQGTAFALDCVGLVTCAHVVEPRGVLVRVWLPESYEEKVTAKVVLFDRDLDLAVLSAEPAPKHHLQLGDARKVKIGDPVKVLGFPNYAEGHTVHQYLGTVAGRKKRFKAVLFSLSAPIYAGTSGGPVLNIDNEVIGIAVTGVRNDEGRSETEFGAIAAFELDNLTHDG
jgi:RNA-directed DNA polymerase